MPDAYNREAPRIILPTEEDIDRVRGYRVTKWKTFDNYECVHCQYSTLWRPKMEKHLALGQHPWAYPSQTEAEVVSAPIVTDGLEY